MEHKKIITSQAKWMEVPTSNIPTPFADNEVVVHAEKASGPTNTSEKLENMLSPIDKGVPKNNYQCWSTGKIQPTPNTPRTEYGEWYANLRQTLYDELYLHLPTMIESLKNDQSSIISAKDESQRSETNVDAISKIQSDILRLNTQHNRLCDMVNGYQDQVEVWKVTVQAIQTRERDLTKDIRDQKKSRENHEKEINNRMKNLMSIENKIKEEFNEMKKIKNDLKSIQKSTEIKEITKAQEFVGAKYDEIIEETKKVAEQVKSYADEKTKSDKQLHEINKRLETNIKHTHHNSKYSRKDCAELGGVNTTLNDTNSKGERVENCKKLVIDICKEMHLIIPPSAISTAHRLAQHPDKTTPPAIIVRFAIRDFRNDVFSLKSIAREKKVWSCANIEKLYINESLTPEAKKLLYHTKILKREMFRIHGNIWVWTHQGEVYIRKDGDGFQRIRVECIDDLDKIRNGEISLDKLPTENTYLKESPSDIPLHHTGPNDDRVIEIRTK